MRNWTRRVCASALCILCLLALFLLLAAAPKKKSRDDT